MAKIAQYQNKAAGVQAAGDIVFRTPAQSSGTTTQTETQRYVTYRLAGVISNIYIRTTANDRGASTYISRVNVANGNQTISVTGVGEYEDTTNTDTIAAGDEVSTRLTVGAGGTTFSVQVASMLFSATTNTGQYLYSAGIQSFTTDSTTVYIQIGAIDNGNQASETGVENKFQTAGTLANLQFNIRTNTRTTNTLFRSRVNNVDGNQLITITSTDTSGIVEDTSNTDTIAANDLVNTSITTSTGGGTIRGYDVGLSFVTTNSKFMILGGDGLNPSTQANNLTRYHGLGGIVPGAGGDATESNVQQQANVAFTGSNLTTYISAITMTDSTTIRSRVNTANGNQSVAFTTTGRKEDTTNTDTIAATDELSFQVVTGATGTSISFTNLSMMGDATVTTTSPRLFQLLGVGI